MRYSQPKSLRRVFRQSLFLIISLSLILSPVSTAFTSAQAAKPAMPTLNARNSNTPPPFSNGNHAPAQAPCVVAGRQ